MRAFLCLCHFAQSASVKVGDKMGVGTLMDMGQVASPTIGMDGTIYMPTGGAYNTSVMAVHPDGTTKWKFMMLPVSNANFGATVSSPVTLGLNNDLLYVPSSDGNLYALDIHTGMAKWRFKTYGEIDPVDYCGYAVDIVCPMLSKVVVDTDGSLFFKGDVSVYHVSDTGKFLWTTQLPDLYPDDSCDDYDYWLSEHVEIAGGVLYLQTKCHFFALDTRSGDIMWNQTASHYGDAPRVGRDGTLYALTREVFEEGSRLVAFNSSNISVLKSWTDEGGGRRVLLEEDIIYVSTDRAVHAVDTTGAQRWNRTWWDEALDYWVSSPVICGETLYVTTANICSDLNTCDDSKGRWGQLRALDKQTGAEKWAVTPNFSSTLFDCSTCSDDVESGESCSAFCNANRGTEPACTADGNVYFGMTKETMFEFSGWLLWAAASSNGTLLWSLSDWEAQTPVLV